MVLGCGATTISMGGDTAGSDDGLESVAGDGETAVEEGPPPDSERVFSLDTLHTLDFTLGDRELDDLRRDPYTFVVGDVQFDGADFVSVGVRLKGRLGSFRDLNAKAAFKIDFNAFGGTAELEGLETLNVNNMVQDCAFVHEWAAYAMFRAIDLPAARVGWAWVRVNGADYGVYSLVEEYDAEFLKGWYPDPTGNLYDGDYVLDSGWSYTLVDFNAATQDLFELDEGVDVGRDDVHAITSARRGGDFQPDLGSLVDLDAFARFQAATAWIGHSDSYIYYSNNYRVYFDVADGRAEFFPWDPDWAFYDQTALASPYGLLAQDCKADPTCHAAFLDTIIELNTVGPELLPELERAIELVTPSIADDPRAETDPRTARACQDALRTWFTERGDVLDGVTGL